MNGLAAAAVAAAAAPSPDADGQRCPHCGQPGERLNQAEKLAAVSDIAARIAHDFNNLLTVIIGNLDLMVGLPLDPPKARVLTNAALTAGRRAAELTEKLLAFSQRQPLEPTTIELQSFLRETVAALRQELGDGIDIVLHEGAGLWPVSVDEAQLKAAIVNLATNAREAMPKGGTLTIETANRSGDLLDRENRAGDAVVIAVGDTGSGMRPDVAARAFEPFFTTKSSHKGTGFGLAVAYGFARQSGGDITLASEVGRGSTFRLSLPRAGADTAGLSDHLS